MMSGLRRSGVPVVPNASCVRGKLLHVEPNANGGSIWDVAVDEARDVETMPNFGQGYVGQTIHLYIHPQFHSNVRTGDIIEARVAYRGDEKGGRFTLVEDDLRKL